MKLAFITNEGAGDYKLANDFQEGSVLVHHHSLQELIDHQAATRLFTSEVFFYLWVLKLSLSPFYCEEQQQTNPYLKLNISWRTFLERVFGCLTWVQSGPLVKLSPL